MNNNMKKMFIYITAVILVLLGSVVGYKNIKEQKYEKAIELGINYLREEKYEEAILIFNDAIDIDYKKHEAYDYMNLSNAAMNIKTAYENGEYNKALELIDTLKDMNYADVIIDKINIINEQIQENLPSEEEVYAKLLKSREWLELHAEYDNDNGYVNSRTNIRFLPLDVDKDDSLDLLLYHEGTSGNAGLTLSVISYDKIKDRIKIRDINTGHGGYAGYLSDSNMIMTYSGKFGASYLFGYKLENDSYVNAMKIYDDYGHYPEEESYRAVYEINDEKVSVEEYKQYLENIQERMSHTEMYELNDVNIRNILGVEPKNVDYKEIKRYMGDEDITVEEAKKLIYKEDSEYIKKNNIDKLELVDTLMYRKGLFSSHFLPKDVYYMFNAIDTSIPEDEKDEPEKYLVGKYFGRVYSVSSQLQNDVYLIKNNEIIDTKQYCGSDATSVKWRD